VWYQKFAGAPFLHMLNTINDYQEWTGRSRKTLRERLYYKGEKDMGYH